MNRFRDLRKKFGYSQDKLAALLNVHQTAVSQWELGKNFPDVNTLIKLSELYQTSVDYLLGKDSNVPTISIPKKEAPLPVPMLEKDAQKLLDMYDEMSKESKDQVMRYVTSLYYVDRANKSAQYSGALAAYEGGTQQHTVSKETAEKVLRRLDNMEKDT